MTRVADNTPNWIVATVALGAALYFLRDMLAPAALALMLWIAIAAIADWVKNRVPILPRWSALLLAIAVVAGDALIILQALAEQIGEIASKAEPLQARLDALAGALQRQLGIGGPAWTVDQALGMFGPVAIMGQIAGMLNALAGQATMVLIYLLFLFPAGASVMRKLPLMATGPGEARQWAGVFAAIRVSVERYLLVQTVISVIIAVLSYVTLVLIGLPNALFWCLLMFFLNYIPTIGSIIAVALPTLFALVAFSDWRYAAAVAIGLHIWQFGIGTFVQPRMTGGSLNLSTLVVVLSLTFWGSIWGLAGVFLAAPLTVLVMIVLAQFPATRWIAILLSADGNPAIVVHEPDAAELPVADAASAQ
ncbi:MAG TPA: AI-2E family transporter [Caulobacterales bacterium]|nr:AI-2E family transporter [Caulobacterales bacterium]